ncbi:superinfection immunity protein [Trinickia terrae]|uniref:Superinfection immunity protein n=1 Tax=Trinickia terrae TaxID=2571161 RepID=A0A4V5PL73_9BURK|nr:superinfection immunity protein [Trinickia terrae]TKC92470.1 superinfection immunity protein [Trinickia terrae]
MQGGIVIQTAEVIGALAAYFLPAIVADRRKRLDVLLIALFNACLGWTVVGWLIALYWAFQPNPPADVADEVKSKRRLLSLSTFSKGLAERVQARAAKRDRARN